MFSLSRSLALSLCSHRFRSLALSLSLCLTLTCSLSHSRSPSLCLSVGLSVSLSRSLALSLSFFLPVSPCDSLLCSSPFFFFGLIGCSAKLPFCKSNPCQNGGTCSDSWETFSCECPLGFGGKDCSHGESILQGLQSGLKGPPIVAVRFIQVR